MRSHVVLSLVTTTALLSLSACASIVEGSTDKVSIITTPPSNASCTLTNSRGSYNTFASGAAVVKRSTSDLNIVCADPSSGARGQSTVASDAEAWAFGNILIGGLIGLGVDWGTGAAYTYPNSTTVSMVAPVAAVTPVPPEYQTVAPANGIAPTYAAPAVNAQPNATDSIQPVAPSVAPAPNFIVPSAN